MPTDQERLVVSLEARIRDFERNMQKASRTGSKAFDDLEARAKQSAGRMEQAMSAAAGKVGGALKGFGAGILGGLTAAGISGIVTEVGNIAKGIAEVGDQAKRAGLSNKAFQELAFVAQQSRIPVDALTDGMKELSLRADEFIQTGGGSAAESFQRLGFTASDLAVKLKDPSALFTEIIGKLGQLDKAAQIRIADELFGGTGGEQFVQLLGQGEDGIRKLIQAAHDTGAVMDDELIAKAAELDRKFQAVTTTVGNGLKTAVVETASALSDLITKLQSFYDKYKEARGAVEAGELVGSMVPPPDGGPSRFEVANSEKLNELAAQRVKLLDDVKTAEIDLATGKAANVTPEVITALEEELELARKQLATVEEQIAAQRRLNAERARAPAADQVYIGGRNLDRSQQAMRNKMEMDRASWPELPASVDETPSKREDPLLFGDPPDTSRTAAQAGENMALAFIRKFEGFREKAYWDVNHYRAGYGSDTTTRENGRVETVTASTIVSLADANRDLARRVAEFQNGIRGQIGGDTFASFSEQQQAALTSIAYNYGELPDRIVQAIMSGRPDNVAAAFEVLGGENGGINRGRRKQEAALFANGEGATGSFAPDAWGDMRSVTAGLGQQGAAVDALSQRYQQLGQMGVGVFQGLASALEDGKIDASELLSIIGNLIQQLLAMPALPTGTPQAGTGASGSSIFGSILSGIFGGVKLATGGHVRGPGSGTSDSIPAMLSNGEYVVNAASTAKHRALLDAINAGDITPFATGGQVGSGKGAPFAAPAMGGSSTFAPVITINQAQGGSPAQNRDQAQRTREEIETLLDQKMSEWSTNQMRPGGVLTRKGLSA